MKDLPENELLSAYLDGELTADEQGEVERLLARSPAARQLLDELRALSSTLQALPQYKLAEDLSERVLRTAERRMLTQPASPGKLPKPALPPRREAILRRVFNSRALVWSSLAVGVAVMLWFFNGRPHDELAVAPPAAEKADGDAAGSSQPEEAPTLDEQPEVLGRNDVQTSIAAETQGKAGGDTGLRNHYGASLEKAPGLPRPTDVARQPAEDRVVQKQGLVRDAPGGPPASHFASRSRRAGEDANGTGGGLTAGDRGEQIGKGYSLGMKRAAGGAAGLGVNVNGSTRGVNGGQLTLNLAENLVQADAPYAVVCSDISPKAFRGQALDRVLAANGIALIETVTEINVAEMNLAGGTQTHLNVLRAPQQDGEKREEQQQAGAGGFAYVPQIGKLDLVCVEATHEQIEATLTALNEQSGEFLTLSVDPALGVEAQQDWGRRYGRGRREEFRRGGTVRTGRADDATDTTDTAETDSLTQAGAPIQERQDIDGDGGPPLGSFWRLQVPSSALRRGLDDRMRSLQGGQVSGAVQQPEPPADTATAPEVAQPPAEKSAGTSTVEQTAEPAIPAEAPPPAEQEGKSADPSTRPQQLSTPGEWSAKSRASDKLLENRPAPAGRPKESPALGDRPGKSPGPGKRSYDSPKAGFGGQAPRRSASREKAGEAENGREPHKLGTAERGPSSVPPADKDREGGRRLKGAGEKPPARDEPKGESRPRQEQELAWQRLKDQQFKQRALTYRVLFVLRMAGPDIAGPPSAAASMMDRAEPAAAETPAPAKR